MHVTEPGEALFGTYQPERAPTLRGAPGAGACFPQFIAADGARMDDVLGGAGAASG